MKKRAKFLHENGVEEKAERGITGMRGEASLSRKGKMRGLYEAETIKKLFLGSFSRISKLFGKVTVNNIYTDFFCALFCIMIFLT